MPDQTQEKFEFWALLEIFGHQRFAGVVAEANIGGCSFVRLDVPAVNGNQAFTKFFGQNAIYAITPVSEEVAKTMAAQMSHKPVNVYQLEAPKFGQREMYEPGDDEGMPL